MLVMKIIDDDDDTSTIYVYYLRNRFCNLISVMWDGKVVIPVSLVTFFFFFLIARVGSRARKSCSFAQNTTASILFSGNHSVTLHY